MHASLVRVVVGVHEAVDLMILDDLLIRRRRNHDAGVGFLRIEEDRTIHVLVGCALVQIVQTHEGADFRTVGAHLAGLVEVDGTHIIEDCDLMVDQLGGDAGQSFNGLRLAGAGVAHEHDALLGAVMQIDVHHGAVDRQPALLDHRQIVQRQHHLLRIAEVFDDRRRRNLADPDVIGLVMPEDSVFFAVRIAEDHDRVGLAVLHFVLRRHLKQVRDGDRAGNVIAVEIRQHQQRADLGREADPVIIRAAHEFLHGILFHFREGAGALGGGRMQNQRRPQHDLVHERDLEERFIAVRNGPAVILQQEAGVRAGLQLAVDLVAAALHLLLDGAVEVQHHGVEFRVRVDEVLQLVTGLVLRVHDGIALRAPPELVRLFNHFQKLHRLVQSRMVDLRRLKH